MSFNKTFKKNSLKEIDKDLFTKVVKAATNAGVTTIAPLGYSSDDFVIHGDHAPGRSSLVSIRNHSGMVKMLVTDKHGSFLYNGGFHPCFGSECIAQFFFMTFCFLEDQIEEKTHKKKEIFSQTANNLCSCIDFRLRPSK